MEGPAVLEKATFDDAFFITIPKIFDINIVSAACANLFLVKMSFLTFAGALGQVYPTR